jgi:hypothetical protein
MSRTPETDEEVRKTFIRCEDEHCVVWAGKNGDTVDVVDAEFARQLERRLADAEVRIAILTKERDEARVRP